MVTDDGHRHTVWRLPPDETLLPELDRARHYVADGHHRVAASRVLWERAGRPAEPALVCVRARRRRAHAGGVSTGCSPDRSTPGRCSTGSGPATTSSSRTRGRSARGTSRVRLAGHWYAARRRAAHPSGVLPLGVALLEDTLGPTPLEPVRATADELRELADRSAGAGFVLQPPPIDAVLGLADTGRVLPAKTTYFRAKPASGLFVRSVTG